MKLHLYFLVLFHLFFIKIDAQNPEINIISKPINYSKERVQMSIEYLASHFGIVQNNAKITPRIIVIHYTAGGTVESNFQYFNKLKLENKRGYLKKESELNVSSQYIVDRDGKIYQLMDDNLFARHTIGLNYCAIGIENIGSKKNPLTALQLEANTKLVEHLKKKYPEIEFLIGHSEYGTFRGSDIWKEKNPTYFTGKEDPGNDFMKKLREKTKKLSLKSKP